MPIPPVFGKDDTAVFLACDERFLPHTLVTIASIMENADPGARYDIIVLTDNVQQEKTTLALSWFARYPNGSLRFFDVGDELEIFGRDKFHV
ncbi:MAG: hypothetical protein LBS30_01905, partial [Planctomycetota bacterium]|nr:hypothetical protein [Planctomycetota bacterium]